MKSFLTFTLVAIVAATFVIAQEKTETRSTIVSSPVAWFDMGGCEVCNCMAKNQEMMAELKWEVHIIPNGALSVAVVPEKMKQTMKSAMQEASLIESKIEKGEKVRCCGYCQSMSALIKGGAKKKELSTVGGEIRLVTSYDPAVVKQIHAHAKRTIDETKKLMQATPAKIHGVKKSK